MRALAWEELQKDRPDLPHLELELSDSAPFIVTQAVGRLGPRQSRNPPCWQRRWHLPTTVCGGAELIVSACKRALRRTPASAAHMHVSADVALPESGCRSLLGALYASYSLWELASVLSAILWLLACLAA